MFDVLLKELAKRLSLGDKANGLLSMLLSLIFDEKRGGFAGFIDRFRAKGMGDTLSSWLGNSENRSLSHAQLETALGPQVIQQMAARLDLAPSAVSTALTHLLPTVIDKLSPDGQLPSGLAVPETARAYMSQFSDFAKTAVLPEVVATQAAQHTITHGAASGSGSNWRWLLLIPVLIAPLFFMHQCQKAPPQKSAVDLPIVVPPAADLPEPAAAPATNTETPVMQDGLEATANASVDASAAIDKLAQTGTFTATELTNALNLMIVHFDSGKATIKQDSLPILEKAAGVITKAPAGTRLQVGGHTDSRGNAADNLALSAARAEAVKAHLQGLGVDSTMLSAKGFGDTLPVADNTTKAGRAKNRRIEFTVQD